MGRGRKPKTEKKGYFYEPEEEAFINYINAETKKEKDRIFNESLLPAFTKMIESIIRRYNLYPPDEEFQETFDDTISFLMTKISNFNAEMGKKAYSYCGAICKNYLIYKINQFNKNQKRNESYEDNPGALEDRLDLSYDDTNPETTFLGELISDTVEKIQEMLSPERINSLNENEQKIGFALLELLTNWEDLFARMGSNKFNKSSILFFLKEITLLNTKEIRDGMKKYKVLYYNIKKELLD